ncbi:MAG: ABC transporter ATP-binding protein [Deltaproteobacteria bacterium]|nr:ABC transporter ATP-binding protein [Deltaproteobacteria bacterium]
MAESFQQEEILGKAYDFRLIRRTWKFLVPYKRIFFLAMALLPLQQALGLAQPYLMKIGIDQYIAGRDLVGLRNVGLLFLAAVIGETVTLFSHYYLTMQVAQRCLADLRVALFSHVQKLPMSYFDRNPVGRLVTRMTTDVDVLQEMFSAGVITLISDFVMVIWILGIMLYLNVGLALVSLALIPPMAVAINFFRVKARQAYRRIRERIARINAYLGEAISGMAVIQLFTREQKTYREFDELNASHRDAYHLSNLYEAALYSMVEAAGSVSVGLLLWWGGGEVLHGVIGIGTLVAFKEYIHRFFVPLRDFSQKYAVMQSAMAAAERIFQLLDTPVSIESPKNAVVPKPFRGEVVFDKVWFHYRPDDPVLKGVSFRIEPGEKVALVGATGSGKTTTIKLLNRFYDVQKGAIQVGGVDVREWDLQVLRRHIGVVLQDVFLFSGDIRTNLELGDSSIPMDRIERAARVTNAEEFIRRLPDGFQSPVRERGSNFSGGQRQLLSLARVLVFEPEILVMDEATSSVDTETEALIQDALEKIMRDRTCLLIAHRLSTIRNADRIIVLHHGEVREIGSHAELMERQGIYHRLYQLQYERETVKLPPHDHAPKILG